MEHLPRLHRLDELVPHARGNHYVRFSKGPDHDRNRTSRDYESGLELPGLSVNPLRPEPWWTRPLEEWLARQLCNYVHLAEADDDRMAWILGGEVVGRGPDNEPLLRPWAAHAILARDVVEEAKALYRERFDVGKDSTSSGHG
jgi:hypothetical protein